MIKNNEKDLLRFAVVARRFFVYQARQQDWDKALGGWCLLASRTLEAILNHFGYDAKVVGTSDLSGHFWVEVGNYIIDITATQFGVIQPITFIDKREGIPDMYEKKGRVILTEDNLEVVHKRWHRFAITDEIISPYANEILNWLEGIKTDTKIDSFLDVCRNRERALTNLSTSVILK